MEPRFTLLCEYLSCLQINYGLTQQDLASPNLFRVCGNRIADQNNFHSPNKFHSGVFKAADGKDLSHDPQKWPGGIAFEVEIGPWRFADTQLRAATGSSVKDWTRDDYAFRLCSDQLAANGYNDGMVTEVPADKDWASKAFDLAGVNANVLSYLDRAEWHLRSERPVIEKRVRPNEVPKPVNSISAEYSLADGFTARLFWNLDSMIEGAYLLRRRAGELDTLSHFDSLPAALLALSLLPGGPADPIRDTIGSVPESWEREIKDTVYRTRISAR